MGRPRTALVDRDRIARAALELVDATGDFTVPALARKLNVQAASLYHHVDGRAGIVELLRDRLAADAALTLPAGLPWDEALAAVARAYRAVVAGHPRLIPLLATTTIRAPLSIGFYEDVAAFLHRSGFAPRDSLMVFTTMENFILGSALDLAAPAVMWEVPDDVPAPELRRALDAAPGAAEQSERAFETGLAALLVGFGGLRRR